MRQYNITPEVKTFPFGDLNVLSLGEKGRGRKEAIIPVQPNKGTCDLEVSLTKAGKPKLTIAKLPAPGWIARISARGTYTRGTMGTVWVQSDKAHQIKVIAHGYGAYGDAGRVGSWDDFLVQVPDNTLFVVYPSGGTHKCPPRYLLFTPSKVLEMSLEEVELHMQMPLEYVNLFDLKPREDA